MEHIPVLLSKTLEGLQVNPQGIYVDGTLGRGGHSLEIVKRLKTGRLIAIDCDEEAINEVKEKTGSRENKITYVNGNFKDTAEILKSKNIQAIDGAIFDLGVSSPQLDDISRGFSYQADAQLDMRMDKNQSTSAYDLINTLDEKQLGKILRDYGEERYWGLIAKKIVSKRISSPIKTTFELNDIIISAIPAKARREKQHPSKRTFQALRIAVGDELGCLDKMLKTVPYILKPGGRICIISFHSLEDRIVKQSFTQYAISCECPKNLPICVCNKTPVLKIITKKPITADTFETAQNPRARSAKLRIAERI